MKIKLIIAIILLFSSCAYADQTTSFYKLIIPSESSMDWHDKFSNDVITIDTVLGILSNDASVQYSIIYNTSSDVSVLKPIVLNTSGDVVALKPIIANTSSDVGVLKPIVLNTSSDVGVLKPIVLNLSSDEAVTRLSVDVLRVTSSNMSTDVGVLKPIVSNLSTDVGVLKLAGATGILTAGTSCVQNPFTVNTKTTQAHGLGAIPTMVIAYYECISNDNNYVVGARTDALLVDSQNSGSVIEWDATNVYILSGNLTLYSYDNTSPTSFITLTAAKWKVVAVPYKLN